jgi:hypothetical protein
MKNALNGLLMFLSQKYIKRFTKNNLALFKSFLCVGNKTVNSTDVNLLDVHFSKKLRIWKWKRQKNRLQQIVQKGLHKSYKRLTTSIAKFNLCKFVT